MTVAPLEKFILFPLETHLVKQFLLFPAVSMAHMSDHIMFKWVNPDHVNNCTIESLAIFCVKYF